MNNVYLIPHANGTYEAAITSMTPSENAVLLTAEGEYPVEVYYYRFDANGDSILEKTDYANSKDLIYGLKGHGNAFHVLRGLWDFDSYKELPDGVSAILNAAYEKSMEIVARWAEDVYDESRSICFLVGVPTVGEMVKQLSQFPEDYRVTCCGMDCCIRLFRQGKYIVIESEDFMK